MRRGIIQVFRTAFVHLLKSGTFMAATRRGIKTLKSGSIILLVLDSTCENVGGVMDRSSGTVVSCQAAVISLPTIEFQRSSLPTAAISVEPKPKSLYGK